MRREYGWRGVAWILAVFGALVGVAALDGVVQVVPAVVLLPVAVWLGRGHEPKVVLTSGAPMWMQLTEAPAPALAVTAEDGMTATVRFAKPEPGVGRRQLPDYAAEIDMEPVTLSRRARREVAVLADGRQLGTITRRAFTGVYDIDMPGRARVSATKGRLTRGERPAHVIAALAAGVLASGGAHSWGRRASFLLDGFTPFDLIDL